MNNVRVILAWTVLITLVLLIIATVIARLSGTSPDPDWLDVADELLGIVGVILGGIVSGLLVSGNKDDDNDSA